MAKEIVISEQENIAATFENEKITEFFMNEGEQLVGDIILGKVDSIIQSIDAAFVSIGKNRNGFIHITDLCLKNAKKRIGIKNHLHPKQSILVQIAKEATGSKGPRLTGMLTIPGKYMVLTPYERKVGISKKITDSQERDRLVYISKKICQSGYGIIIRTEAMGQSEEALKEDLDFLLKRWSEILKMSETMTAPAVLYRDQDLLYRVLRDAITPDVEKIVVDTPDGKLRAVDLLQSWSHNAFRLVQQNRTHVPLSQQYNVFSEIEKALQPKAPLPSGGYLIIEKTEALTVIDVNSGNTRGTSGLSETILQTNKEAAVEIARQLKLRDIGGVIVIDFIDMLDPREQQIVWQMLANAVKNDKAQPQIGYFSEFSLLEMTRHRQKKSITELLTSKCPYCDGIGKIRNSVYRSDLLTTESINKRVNKFDNNPKNHESANSKQMEEFTNSVEYVENRMDRIPQNVLDHRKENESSNQISYPKFDRNNNKYDDAIPNANKHKDDEYEDAVQDDEIEVIEIEDAVTSAPIVNKDVFVEEAYNKFAKEEPKEKAPSPNDNFVVELTEEERKYIESIEEPFDNRRRNNNFRDKKFNKNKKDFTKKNDVNNRYPNYNNEEKTNVKENNSFNEEVAPQNDRFRNPNQGHSERNNKFTEPRSEHRNDNYNQQNHVNHSQEPKQHERQGQDYNNQSTVNDKGNNAERPQRNFYKDKPYQQKNRDNRFEKRSYDNQPREIEKVSELENNQMSVYENTSHHQEEPVRQEPVRQERAIEQEQPQRHAYVKPVEIVEELPVVEQVVEVASESIPAFTEEVVIIEEPVLPKKRGRKPNPKKIKPVETEVVAEEVKSEPVPEVKPEQQLELIELASVTNVESSETVESTSETEEAPSTQAKPKKRGRIKSFSPKTKKRI